MRFLSGAMHREEKKRTQLFACIWHSVPSPYSKTLHCPMGPTSPLGTNHHSWSIHVYGHYVRAKLPFQLISDPCVRGPTRLARDPRSGRGTTHVVVAPTLHVIYTKLFDWLSRRLGQLYFSKFVYGTCDSVPWRSRQTYAHGCNTFFFFLIEIGEVVGVVWWSGATVGKRNLIRPMMLSRQWHYNLRVPRLLFLPAFSRRRLLINPGLNSKTESEVNSRKTTTS